VTLYIRPAAKPVCHSLHHQPHTAVATSLGTRPQHSYRSHGSEAQFA
jgi:hypothetical protein